MFNVYIVIEDLTNIGTSNLEDNKKNLFYSSSVGYVPDA